MLSRRLALLTLAFAGLGFACSGGTSRRDAEPRRDGEDDSLPPEPRFADNVDALFDVLIPAEHDGKGKLISPGAREAGANELLARARFGTLAVALGFVPLLPDAIMRELEDLGAAFRAALDADLDVLAALERPGVRFRDLPRSAQETLVDRAFEDPVRRPVMEIVRAASFTAYLGAVGNDVGLRAIGYPAFEDIAKGIAVSGYPRTVAGKREDYTFNEAPPATTTEDLSLVLDENGDLR